MIQQQNLSLKIQNNIFYVSNSALIQGRPNCRIVADAGAGTSWAVDNVTGFNANDYIIIGSLGGATSEIVQISSINTSTNTITLTASTVYAHYRDTIIYDVAYNQIGVYYSTSATNTNPTLIKVVSVTPNNLNTIIPDIARSSSYGYFQFLNATTLTAGSFVVGTTYKIKTIGTTDYTLIGATANTVGLTFTATGVGTGTGTVYTSYSDLSQGIIYTGNALNTVYNVALAGAKMVGLNLDTEYTKEDDLLFDARECQNEIIQNSDWTFELTEGSITSITNENTYDLTSLNMKYTDTKKGIFTCLFGTVPLGYFTRDYMDRFYNQAPSTTLSSAAAPGDIVLNVVDASGFEASGTVWVGSDQVTYTSINSTFTQLLGVSASGSINQLVINNQGVNYTVGDVLTISGGGLNAQIKVTFIGSGGEVIAFSIVSGGSGYSTGSNISLTGGTGTSATCNITSVQNANGLTKSWAIGTRLWQNINPAFPQYFTFYQSNLVLDTPVRSVDAGIKINLRYLKNLTDLTSMNDTIVMPFYKIFHPYIAYKIETRRKNFDLANRYYQIFEKQLAEARKLYQFQVMKTTRYYNFNNTLEDSSVFRTNP